MAAESPIFCDHPGTCFSVPVLFGETCPPFMEVRAEDNRLFMAFSLLFAILAVFSTQRLGKVHLPAVVFRYYSPRRCFARNSVFTSSKGHSYASGSELLTASLHALIIAINKVWKPFYHSNSLGFFSSLFMNPYLWSAY